MESNNININIGVDDVMTQLEKSRSFTLDTLLEKNARIHGDTIAVTGEDSTNLTYAEMNERVNSIFASLSDYGIGYGDTIAVLSENRPEFVELYYTGSRFGAPIAAQNWRLEKPELLHCLEVVDADAVFVSEGQKDKIEWIKESDTVTPDVIVGLDENVGQLDYEELISEGGPRDETESPSTNPEDIVSVLYTSGTTGLPKGAAISNRTFLARGQNRYILDSISNDQPDHVAWLPMFHMASADYIAAVALQGGTYHTVDGFKPDVIIDYLVESDVRYLMVVPSTLQPMLDYVDDENIDIEKSSVNLKYIGTQPDLVAPDKIAELSSLFDAKYFNTFGSTETGLPPATGNHFDVGEEPSPEMWKNESPLCDIRLIDDNWERVSQGEVGELSIRGPTLFSGYVGYSEANLKDFNGGWFRTGDLFRRNSEGELAFVDRRKYLIKSGGENIYPAEVEKPLMEHEGIDEAIVVRVGDETWGEVPKVYVAPSSDVEIEPEDILSILDGKIARYKFPHYVEFVDQSEFPRSTSGKIQRASVEDWSTTEDERIRSP